MCARVRECAGNGKVMVEVKQTPDQFLADDTEGVLQVISPVDCVCGRVGMGG